MAYPFFGAYAASKHALEAISDALRRELLLYGIDVIVINPGPIQTPIWDKAEALDVFPYVGSDYEGILQFVQDYTIKRGRNGLPVESVSAVIRRALEKKRPKTRYPVVRNRLISWWLPQLLPDRLIDRVIAYYFRLRCISQIQYPCSLFARNS
jgi:short-subunit dehydrogenase